jgi:hypothetical protein
MKGNHSTDGGDVPYKARALYSGAGYSGSKLGNELATNVGCGGPGAGRTVYQRGMQAQHGSAAAGSRNAAPDVPATKPGRDILNDYGPNRRR